jgi:hypothetical protein
MAVATGTAIALGVAGTQLAGSAMQASAAKKAAKTQAAAGDRALEVQREVYNDQRGMMQPYVQAGQQSIGTLGRLMGAPEGARFAAPPMGGQGGPMSLGQIAPAPLGQIPNAPLGQIPPAQLGTSGGDAPMGQMAPTPMGMSGGNAPMGQGGPVPVQGQAAAPLGPRQPLAALGNRGPSLGQMAQMVTVKTPDGTVQQVPAHLAPRLFAQGALRVE